MSWFMAIAIGQRFIGLWTGENSQAVLYHHWFKSGSNLQSGSQSPVQIEALRDTAALIVFIALFAIFVLFLYWNILHLFLTRKYDKELFKAPYFFPGELAVCTVWPFSLLKTTAYILLITGSPLLAKRRFKDLKEPIINETAMVKFFCYLWKVSCLIFGGIIVAGMIWGGIEMILMD